MYKIMSQHQTMLFENNEIKMARKTEGKPGSMNRAR